MLSGRPGDDGSAIEPLVITDTLEAFRAAGREASAENVARFLAWDPHHPSSIVNCLEATRENARAVRGSITSEMWESINDTWLQLQQKHRSGGAPIDATFFEWVKERSHLFRGVTLGTIRRNQPHDFIRLGTFIERADNTARILSVKQGSGGAQASDSVSGYYSLSAVLRSVSAFEAYRDTYRDAVDARRVAELLIFDSRLPRSLRFCFDEIQRILPQLPQEAGRVARRLSAVIHAGLAHGELDDVYGEGLDQFLERFLLELRGLGDAVHAAYLEMK
jgi:uncharacterized alpha-E superfamily protein